jgi:pyridoxine 4-dehydrogenase
MSVSQKVPGAATAGTVSFGDLTVNRLGFGAMRIAGEGIWGEPSEVAGRLTRGWREPASRRVIGRR